LVFNLFSDTSLWSPTHRPHQEVFGSVREPIDRYGRHAPDLNTGDRSHPVGT
jgi:hypothetical protein